MPRIQKLSAGLRFARHSFALEEKLGAIVDCLIDKSARNGIPEGFVDEVARDANRRYQLRSSDKMNLIFFDPMNIVYTRDQYGQSHGIDIDDVCKNFMMIISAVRDLLPPIEFQRLGLVAEYRADIKKGDNASAIFLNTLTKLQGNKNSAKFHLNFETRYSEKGDEQVDIANEPFTNVIEAYYDSEMDADHPDKGYLNFQLDVQKYSNPPIKAARIADEMSKVRGSFVSHEKQLKARLLKLGLANA